MDDGYAIPEAAARIQQEHRRSLFITILDHAPEPARAQAVIQQVREEFADAHHHCWAFVAGPPGSSTHVGYSDDGEPHGSAGKPMLNVLLHSRVGEIVGVTTRYFGGTKLGIGGLMRAYTGGVQAALLTLPTIQKIQEIHLQVTVAYADLPVCQHNFGRFAARIEAVNYTEQVCLHIILPVYRQAEFVRWLTDLTRGQSTIKVM